jgi:hypothetical protein
MDIATLRPSQSLKLLSKFSEAHFGFRIIRAKAHQHADAPHPFRLLRARRERPSRGSRSAAEKRDELAPFQRPMSPVLPPEG